MTLLRKVGDLKYPYQKGTVVVGPSGINFVVFFEREQALFLPDGKIKEQRKRASPGLTAVVLPVELV